MELAFQIYIGAVGLVFCLFVIWILWHMFKAKKPKKRKHSHPIIFTDRDIDGDLW